MKILNIRCKIHEMASSEILQHIDAHTYQEIKQNDSHPLFKAFVVGHEGESTGKIIGVGGVIKRWMSGAIEMLHNKLKIGTKAFFGHDPDSSNINRQSIGRLVGKALKKINDVMHTIGIIYIDREHRNKDVDIASIEGDIRFNLMDDSGKLKADVLNVNDISGIALANSNFEKPGFPGATLQAQFQEFAKDIDGPINGGKKMDLEQIKKEIKDEGIMPSELFEKSDLASDPVVLVFAKEKNRNEYEARKRNQTEFKDVEDKYKTDIDDLQGKLKEAQGKALMVDARKELEKELTNGGNLPDEKKKFIQFDFDNRFKIQDTEKMTDEIKAYFKNKSDEFDTVFGKQKEPKKDQTDNVGFKGIGPNPKEITMDGGKDYSDPAKNEWIPKQ